MTCRPTRLELAALESRDDGTVYAEVACARSREWFPATFAPGTASGSGFSEHLVLVAITFALLLNRGLWTLRESLPAA